MQAFLKRRAAVELLQCVKAHTEALNDLAGRVERMSAFLLRLLKQFKKSQEQRPAALETLKSLLEAAKAELSVSASCAVSTFRIDLC